jgi:hypothetical protein
VRALLLLPSLAAACGDNPIEGGELRHADLAAGHTIRFE